MMQDPVVDVVLRAALALLFASAARHKLRDLAGFRGVLQAYRLLPERLVAVTAPVVVGIELGLAAALVLPATRSLAGLGAAALLTAYSFAIAINLARGRRAIDCGCGGPGARQPISEWLVLRNALLTGAALFTLAPAAARPLLWVDWLTGVGGLVVIAAGWTAAHGLAAAAARVPALGAPS